MKQESHRRLGRYLLENLREMPKPIHTRAFLIGCVEPDRNPLSYLKGSIRARWFYGHNYQNADRWIERHIKNLEGKNKWNAWNYYCMGKLIHYTSDAFTYVHNNCFTEPISRHRAYEDKLQQQFFRHMDRNRRYTGDMPEDTNNFFRSNHDRYIKNEANVHRDCHYILKMTNWLFCRLIPEPTVS